MQSLSEISYDRDLQKFTANFSIDCLLEPGMKHANGNHVTVEHYDSRKCKLAVKCQNLDQITIGILRELERQALIKLLFQYCYDFKLLLNEELLSETTCIWILFIYILFTRFLSCPYYSMVITFELLKVVNILNNYFSSYFTHNNNPCESGPKSPSRLLHCFHINFTLYK